MAKVSGPTDEKTDLEDRIRQAIQHWGGSQRKLARELGKTGVRGASQRTLVSYLKGDTGPSAAWLREAAGILGVSLEWLAHSKGQMVRDPMASRDGDQLKTTMTALRESLQGSGLDYQSVPPSAFWAFAYLLERFSRSVADRSVMELDDGEAVLLARHLMLGVYQCMARLTGHFGHELEGVSRAPEGRLGIGLIFEGLALLIQGGPSIDQIQVWVDADWEERVDRIRGRHPDPQPDLKSFLRSAPADQVREL